MADLVGREKEAEHTGAFRRRLMNWNVGAEIARAPPMTNAREGSQAGRSGDRNLQTLPGDRPWLHAAIQVRRAAYAGLGAISMVRGCSAPNNIMHCQDAPETHCSCGAGRQPEIQQPKQTIFQPRPTG
jgi:hypothetical protein